MGPHFPIHRWRHQQTAAITRTRQTSQTEQFVGPPLREFGNEIRTGGGNHHRISLSPELDVGHVIGLTRVPLAHDHGLAR